VWFGVDMEKYGRVVKPRSSSGQRSAEKSSNNRPESRDSAESSQRKKSMLKKLFLVWLVFSSL